MCACTEGRACPPNPCANPPPVRVSPPPVCPLPYCAHPGGRTAGPAQTLPGGQDTHPPLRTTPVPPPPLTGPCRTGGSVPGKSVPGGSVPIAPLSSGGRRRQLHAPGSVLPPPHNQVPLPPAAGAACEPGCGTGAGPGAAPPRPGLGMGQDRDQDRPPPEIRNGIRAPCSGHGAIDGIRAGTGAIHCPRGWYRRWDRERSLIAPPLEMGPELGLGQEPSPSGVRAWIRSRRGLELRLAGLPPPLTGAGPRADARTDTHHHLQGWEHG